MHGLIVSRVKKPKKHQHIITKLAAFLNEVGEEKRSFVSKDSFRALDPLAKKNI